MLGKYELGKELENKMDRYLAQQMSMALNNLNKDDSDIEMKQSSETDEDENKKEKKNEKKNHKNEKVLSIFY